MVVAAILAGVNQGAARDERKVDLVEKMPAEEDVIFSGVVQKCPFADGRDSRNCAWLVQCQHADTHDEQ